MLKVTLDLKHCQINYHNGRYTDAVWVGNQQSNAEQVEWKTHSQDYFAMVVFGGSNCSPLTSPHGDDRFIVTHDGRQSNPRDLAPGVIASIQAGSVNARCEFEFCYVMIRNDLKYMYINCCTKTYVEQGCPDEEGGSESASVDVLYDDAAGNGAGGVMQAGGLEGILGGIFSLFPSEHGLRESSLPSIAVFKPKQQAARPKLIVRR